MLPISGGKNIENTTIKNYQCSLMLFETIRDDTDPFDEY